AVCTVFFNGANVAGANTVTFQTLPLTATQQANCGVNAADYQGVVTTFTSTNGAAPVNNSGGGQTVNVPICFDAIFEQPEFFLAQLTNPTGGAVAANASTAACGSSTNPPGFSQPAVAPAAGQCGQETIRITDNNVQTAT